MVIKDIWRSKRCKVEQHNANSADKILYVKEIPEVYIQTFSKFMVFANDNTVTDFCARIIDVCLF